MPQNSTDTGRLTVTVRSANGALPVEGALVTITKDGAVFAVTASDNSGNTEIIEIPTPPKSASLSPGFAGLPYTRVFIEVDKEGFYNGQYIEVPVFPDVLTVQPVNLLPLPEFFAGDTFEGTQFFDESEGYDL